MTSPILSSTNAFQDTTPIAAIFFQDPLPVINRDKEWIGGWPELRWNELIQLAKALSNLFAQLLQIDHNEVFVQAVEHLDGSMAQAGLRIYANVRVDDDRRHDLHAALPLFMSAILQNRDEISARLEFDMPPSDEVRRVVEDAVDNVLTKYQGRRIVTPMKVSLDDIHILAQGRHAAHRPTDVTEHQFIVDARIEGYSRRSRTCELLCVPDKKYLTIAFDVECFLGDLRQRACDDVAYQFTLRKTQDAKGKSIVILQHVGDPVADQSILSH